MVTPIKIKPIKKFQIVFNIFSSEENPIDVDEGETLMLGKTISRVLSRIE